MDHHLNRVNYYQESLKRFIKSDRPLMLILGQHGSGKSELIKQFSANTPSTHTPVIINSSEDVAPGDIIHHISHQWGLTLPAKSQSQRLQLDNLLFQMRQQNLNKTLIFTNAHRLTIASLAAICHMASSQESPPVSLHLILVGQVNLEDKITSLMANTPPTLLLQPLTEKETYQYIRFRINKLNRDNPYNPPPEIMKKIYEHSGGFPSLINHLIQRWIYQESVDHPEKLESKPPSAANPIKAQTMTKRKKYLISAVATIGAVLVALSMSLSIHYFKGNTYYSIALYSNSDLSKVKQFAHQHQLEKTAFIYSETSKHDYTLLLGHYKSKQQAQDKIQHLDKPLKQLHPKPYKAQANKYLATKFNLDMLR